MGIAELRSVVKPNNLILQYLIWTASYKLASTLRLSSEILTSRWGRWLASVGWTAREFWLQVLALMKFILVLV